MTFNMMPDSAVRLSIIIPTLNEEGLLDHTLSFLAGYSHEMIVVDGGSLDRTMEVAFRYTPHVLSSACGRGPQQDRGARYAHGEIFLFLHADTLLPHGFESMIEESLSDPHVVFGAFRLSIYPSRPLLNLIAIVANLRSWFLRMPYGDQALLFEGSAIFSRVASKISPSWRMWIWLGD
ncbi:MAG: glycosyltransferase [Pseudomonadota bacterium]